MKKLLKLFLTYSLFIYLIGAIDFITFEIVLNPLNWSEFKLAFSIILLICLILFIVFTSFDKKSIKKKN